MRLKIRFFAGLLTALLLVMPVQQVLAGSDTFTIAPELYLFEDGNSHYEVSDGAEHADETALGNFSLSGALEDNGRQNGCDSYRVTSGNVSFSYELNPLETVSDEYEWQLEYDDSCTVDGLKLDEAVGEATVLVESSMSGLNWTLEAAYTDVENEGLPEILFTTQDIQQLNGCYYRILVVYEQCRRIEDSHVLFFSYSNYDYRKIAEVYTCYLENAEAEDKTVAQDYTALGTVTLTDKTFSNGEPISEDDPHYGWELGDFYLSDTTGEIPEDGVYLKQVGGQVSLKFYLKQDIDALNEDPELSISEDTNGSDPYFGIEETNFKKGALIIRRTDAYGDPEPVVYKNFLEADAVQGQSITVTQLPEGDYEAALDYEILDSTYGSDYTHYRLSFSFSIRNDNCTVYPIDLKNGDELSDKRGTENGFSLDQSRSRYLDVEVTYSRIDQQGSSFTAEVVATHTASDGEKYTDAGIYEFQVTNPYTEETGIRTAYVGSTPIIKALSGQGLSLEEVNEALSNGAELNEDGTLLFPEEESSEESSEEEEPTEKKETSQAERHALAVRIVIMIAAGVVITVLIMVPLFIWQKKHYTGKKDKEETFHDLKKKKDH